jgi:hypothetical protein
MGATLGRVINNYRGLVETCRARADELELSRAEIDRIGGLPAGVCWQTPWQWVCQKAETNVARRP